MSGTLKKHWIHRASAMAEREIDTVAVYLATDLEEVLKDVRDTMQNLCEYWNGNHNERAMVDALEHTEREAQRLLARLR